MSRYDKLGDREPFSIDTEEEFWRFACCDCGSVHDMHMKVDRRNPERVIMYLVRRNRSSGQLRRNGYGFLQNGRDENWVMVRRNWLDAYKGR